jgi:hypothetical protein
MAKAASTPTKACRARSRRDRRSQAKDSQASVPASDRQPQASSRAKTGVRRKPVSFPADSAPAPRRVLSRNAESLTPKELEALWRPSSDFIGPVAPPMWLWERNPEKQAIWSRMHGLR